MYGVVNIYLFSFLLFDTVFALLDAVSWHWEGFIQCSHTSRFVAKSTNVLTLQVYLIVGVICLCLECGRSA